MAPTRLLALDRDRFLEAVTGLPESHAAAEEIATSYVGVPVAGRQR